ncbi:MAG TPA: ribonuclease E inhibitor RraB [Frankiaceae bacterium]|nr:ribonuclease E inhibitor RraB [Frankiaceae bacterium]
MGIGEQLDLNIVQLRAFRDSGDDLTKPREVEHFGWFKGSRAAERAARELAGLGYDTTVRRDGWRSFELRAARVTAIDEETADTFTREVHDVVVWHGGDYEGWGASVA